MSDRMFDSTVFVESGNSLIEEIACLEDELEVLDEWPRNRRGPIYNTALRACQRAFESGYPLSAARQTFIGFAKSVNILEDVTIPLPWLMGGKTGASGFGCLIGRTMKCLHNDLSSRSEYGSVLGSPAS
ncbi:DUF982 domain-containing protein [Aminobacter sp. MET-1]|uniref:DUF982 domain-containing protein n=1 Tax=Aminobacter sp. MET-1 TaxID=2951085 RepID=UPI002B409601|nr:DUF982 domain-containing protein [Aminobacter sp. MET-1]